VTGPRILIAGIGNIFLGDDAFGVEVAQRLLGRAWPEGVRVVDFGIRGFDLAYSMMSDCDVTILVDAAPRGEAPGTLFVIEPDLAEMNAERDAEIETHAMNPVAVLRLVNALGSQPGRVLVVGCEPASFGPDEGWMGLSEPVQAAVDEAVPLVESLVEQILSEARVAA
jgi:hydrogenase maturation protease